MRLAALLLAVQFLAFASSQSADNHMSSAGQLAQKRIAALKKSFGVQSGGCLNTPGDCGPDAPIRRSQLQSETTIAVDATGQHVVIGFNDFRGFPADPATAQTSLSGFMYSDDGGATFVDGGQLPVGPTALISGQEFPQLFGDPDVKYLGACTFVYSSLLLKGYGASGLVVTLAVNRSTDCGHTWTAPVEVTPATNPNGFTDVNGNPLDSADKELTDVDPDTGRYMLCWTNFTPVAVSGVQISCTYSDNIAAASPVFAPRRVVAAGVFEGQGSSVRFAGNGSPNVYLSWAQFTGPYTNNIGFARSTDNGVTWSSPASIASDFITMDMVLGNDRSNTNPSVAVDKTAGPFTGYIYIVYSNNNTLDGADVVLQRSTDRGVTFSAPFYLNARPGADRPQWFPYVTVDRTTGRVWVFYYDQGVASSGDLSQVTYQYSDDGGSSWSPPLPLTERPFKAGWGNDPNEPNLGDYNQAVAQFGNLFAAYAVTTQPGFTDGQPSFSMTTPDIEFRKVTAGDVIAPLRAGTASFTESSGNGNIDPGDQVHLKIPLTNYVTNPLDSETLTAITATLSTTTPGISVTQPSSAYPNLAPGSTAVNSSDFILQVAPAFVPGVPIELSLKVLTNRGSATIPVTLKTGTPVYLTLLSENFNGVAPGALPPGWAAVHGDGQNVVPWTTTNAFEPTLCGSSNKAFHQDANDGNGGSNVRWERLLSPVFTVPSDSDYVTVEFDVCYDAEDDPVLPRTGYDGFFLRVTDLTPGRTRRSVLAEAFEQEFTTDGFQHYPKHFPRNPDPNYFGDMSAWSGFSNGTQHVFFKFPGMAGSSANLRFEYTQDQAGTCADVRPGHQCGVSVDNVVVRSFKSIAPLPAHIQIRSSLSRDPKTGEIVADLTLTNTGTDTAANVRITGASLNGAATTTALANLGNIPGGASVRTTLRFPGSSGAPGSAGVLRVTGSFTGGNFSSSSRVVLP